MPNITNATACGSKHIYDTLRARTELNNVKVYHDDEADNITSGIIISLASPGVDGGLTDGFRDLADPLYSVLVVGSTLTECATTYGFVDPYLEGSTGSNDWGDVVRCTRERTYQTTNKTPSKQTRFILGGLYRLNIV